MNRLKTLLMVPVTSLVRHTPLFPDLGLGYLAAAVKKSGHDVFLRSWNMEPSTENFKRYIKENKFDFIGIKVFTKDVAAANKTIQLIRATLPETVVVVGGPHPSTSEPEDVMTDFPYCDFAFRGEAEIGLPLLLEEIAKNGKNPSLKNLKNIPGLIWKFIDTVHANIPFLNPDIDSFGMPLWEIMHPKDYRAPKIPGGPKDGYSAPIIVTRGCPSICTYCAAYKINGKSVRSRSSASMLKEIEMLYNKYDVRHLFFLDTRFTHNVDVVTEICEGILRNRMDLAWDCVGYENLNTLTEKMLKLMKRAGCKFINMGIESGSDSIRKSIKKQGTAKEIFQKVQMVKDIGIGIRAFFMIGFPGETKKNIEDTVNYAFSLPADSIQFEIPCPHPGTELLGYLKEKYNVKKIDWENFDVYKSPYPLSEIDSSELYRILKKIRRRYKFVSLKQKFLSL
ncbi:MAG: radical SAM protein [Nitrospirota bacterium]